VRKKYFHTVGKRTWVFGAPIAEDDGSTWLLELFRPSSTPVRWTKKVAGEYNPFDVRWEQYGETLRQERMWLSKRYRKQWVSLYMSQNGLCAHCEQALTEETGWHDHHLTYRILGGSDAISNRVCFTRTATARYMLVNLR
jgi:RNA-directed DNA polymerase